MQNVEKESPSVQFTAWRLSVRISFIATLIATTILGCASQVAALNGEPNLPVTFQSVGYRDSYEQQGLVAITHKATLHVESERLWFHDEDIDLSIPLAEIRELEIKRIYATDPNRWIVVRYGTAEKESVALFTAFRFAGWLGGTQEIYDFVRLATEQFRLKQ